MKIARFTHEGVTRLGVVEGGEIADLGNTVPGDVGALLAGPGIATIESASAPRLTLGDVQLEAPIPNPPTFLAVALNYGDHIAETGREAPTVPQIFNKQVTCINAPGGAIHIPRAAPDEVDYEGELGFVIGARCRAVPRQEAASVIAGYLVVNDVSVRDWQMRSPTVTMGKSWDTHGPTGPWVVTADEVGDPHTLDLETRVNGEVRQHSNTRNLIFDCYTLVEHLSAAFTLLPGTIVTTGTPDGVGRAMTPPNMLRAGDTVLIEVERIGALENPVIDEP